MRRTVRRHASRARRSLPLTRNRRLLLELAVALAVAAGASVAGPVVRGNVVAVTPRVPTAVRSHRAHGFVPPSNPPHNIAAVPRLAGALCTSTTTGTTTTYRCDNPCADAKAVLAGQRPSLNTSPACTSATLAAINRARAAEGVGPMQLPRNWDALSVPEQLYVVANLERVARGEPPLVGLVTKLDAAARAGALDASDPLYPLSAATPGPETSNWAGNDYSPLIADYEWVYDDGWGTGNGNVDCTWPRSKLCWAHRDNILGAAIGTSCSRCVMGAAFATNTAGWGTSYAELFLDPGARPALHPYFTWSADVAPELARG